MFWFCFLFIFSDSCQTNYLKIHWTDLRQILRVGRTVAVDDQSEISPLTPHVTLPWQPILLVLFTELIYRTPVASGAAGRANIFSSSLLRLQHTSATGHAVLDNDFSTAVA